jgi:hypothetical protein
MHPVRAWLLALCHKWTLTETPKGSSSMTAATSGLVRLPIPLRDEDQAGGGVETGTQASVFGFAVGAHSDGR